MRIPLEVLTMAGLMVLAVLFLMAMFARMYRKAGPHQALVVYGFRGTRIIKGRGTVIFPMIESYRELSLQLMSFDVAPQQDLYTMQGVAVTVEAVAQIKVKSDPESINTASEQFLTKSDQAREALIRLVMEGHLRGIIGQLSVEQIVKEPEMVGDRDARHLRRRHEQDGPGSDFVHHQGSPRQERIHLQHGPSGHRPHQARRRRRRGRSRARHRHQARRSNARGRGRQSAGRSGARAGRNALAGQTGRSHARSRNQEGARISKPPRNSRPRPTKPTTSRPMSCSSRWSPKQVKVQQVRKGAGDQSAGGRNPAPRERTDRDRAEAGGNGAPPHRNAGRGREGAPVPPKPKAAPPPFARRAKPKPRSF